MRLHQRLIMHWPVLMALVLAGFLAVLLWSLHASQSQLRAAIDDRLIADSQRRAAAIADFITERREMAAELARGNEIQSYYAGRALGMSSQYGLDAALGFVDHKFRQVLAQKKLRGQPVYSRIILFDEHGAVLAEAGTDNYRLPALALRQSRLVVDAEQFRLVAAAPVRHKDALAGTLVTITDLRLLSNLLITSGGTSSAPYQEFLLTDAGANVLAADSAEAFGGNVARAFAQLPENRLLDVPPIAAAAGLTDRLALRTTIAGAPLSILTLMARDQVYGELASSAYTLYLSLFGGMLLLSAFAFERMRRRVVEWQLVYAQTEGHRAQLEHRNAALSEEIARRQAVESDLHAKTAELNRTNGDLQIAAAAFNAQEGMVVTDAERRILRINRAYTEMTGRAAEELVGRRLFLARNERQNSTFFRDMWFAIHETGSWQGEISDQHKDGTVYTRWLTVSVVKNEAGAITHMIGTYYDVTERKLAEQKIKELAFFDQLTGLPNRALLLDRFRQAASALGRSKQFGAVLFIDLDNFKTLNDTLGHDIGDLLLKEVAQRLTRSVRAEDTVARFGGDEFVVLLANLNTSDASMAAIDAEGVAEKIRAILNETYQLTTYEHSSSPSIGITLFNDAHQSFDETLKRADLAMYEAKAAGRNTIRFFDPAMQTVVARRADLEAELREALRKEQFTLHYQPQVADDGRITGAEALLRWVHPTRGSVSPGEYIPIAENTGLILPLGQWVIEEACRQLAVWAKRRDTRHLTLAVNISAVQLHHKDFVAQVLDALGRTGADPQRLKLELTESQLVNNIEDVIRKMTELRAAGIRFALDDFGTGYSSLSYLKRLPLDQLKIDRQFVRDILVDANDAAIAKMIIVLGGSLGLKVIAEGVETEMQRELLARQGCGAYQGYLFSRPLPVDEFLAYVGRKARADRASSRRYAAAS